MTGRPGRLSWSRTAAVIVPIIAMWGCGGPAPAELAPGAPSRVAIAPDPAGSAVAVALVFPGSGWELPGTEGLTLLTAMTLLEPAREPLARLDAQATVACERGLFTVTLIAPAVEWRTATDLLFGALFEPDPDTTQLSAARDRLAGTLSLDHASPAWQARLAARHALHGDTAAAVSWQGPPCGVPERLPIFGVDHVRAGAHRFAPRMARVGLTGPVAPDSARAWLLDRLPASAPPPLPAPSRTAPGRRYVERNTITAWTAHAYPFRPGADLEALHLLGTFLEHDLGPDVDRPDVLDVTYELEHHGDGGSFIIYMVTAPATAADFAAGVAGRIREIAAGFIPAAAWEPVARSHRGRRLLERESPDSRAAAMARALAIGAEPGDGWPELDRLTRARVRAAAAGLGHPARAVVGPRTARDAITP